MPAPRHEIVRLPVGASELIEGDLWSPGEVGPFAVLFVHGFGSIRRGEKAHVLRNVCLDRGWAFAAFDFRAHGRSTGSMLDLRASGLIADLAAIEEFLVGRGVRTLGLVGSSMGGFASLWHGLHSPRVAAVVGVAPAMRFLQRRWDDLSDEQRQQFRATGRLRWTNDWIDTEIGFGLVEERNQFRPERLAAEWRKPLLIFHGLRDDVVPIEDSLSFLRSTSAPDVELRLFKSGDHRLNERKDEIAVESTRFFTRHLGPAA